MELRVLKYFLAVARHENISRAAEELNLTQPTLSRQLAELEEELNIVGTYNLVFNARFMAEQGFGSVLSFSGLLSTDAGDEVGLVFRPLTPELRSRNYLIWKKGQVFSRAGRLVMACFEASFAGS